MEKRRLSFSDLEALLIEFSTSILEKNTEKEIAWELARKCISKLGFEDCVIYFLDNKKKLLIQQAAHGPKNPVNYEIYEPIVVPIGLGISGYVAKSGVGEIVENTALDTRYITDDAMRQSEIAVPIKTKTEIIGVIDCEHSTKGFFTKQHLQILSALASIAAIKIENLRKEKEAQEKEERLIAAQKEMLELQSRALRAQMNPHFVFNALNAIQHFITINDKVNALKYLSLFSKLIRYYLVNLEADRISLDSEMKMLEWYLQLQHLRYEGRFTYAINAKIESMSEAQIPALVLPMLLENCVENTVGDEHHSGTLQLTITALSYKIKVEVAYDAKQSSNSTIDYRKEIPAWQNQVQLLNKLKPYHIAQKIVHSDSDNNTITIQLVLPILTE